MSSRPRTRARPEPAALTEIEVERSPLDGQTLQAAWSKEASARWLFEFLRMDLAALTPGQLLGARADAWVFAQPEMVVNWDQSENRPTVVMLEAVQREVREGIHRVRQGGWFELEEGISYGFARFGDQIIKGRRRATFEASFLAAAMDTVQEQWSRLYECPRCRRLFLKVGKQKYCSPKCAGQAHWENFKARRPARNHEREYARRTQKRLGPTARVKIKAKRGR